MTEYVHTRLRESHGRGIFRTNHTFRVGSEPTRKKLDAISATIATLSALLLPRGYPDSISKDYLQFQIWDTFQALTTYLRGMLCTQALLTGGVVVGVGDERATAASAALQWLFLDGMGMIGGVIFAWGGSKQFGIEPKRWRLFADVINDLGLALKLAAPLCGPFFLLLAGIGSVCQAMCGVAAGATKAAISQHFAKNIASGSRAADIIAKEGVQETMVTLVGLIFGMVLSHKLGNSTPLVWAVFLVLTALHVFANYRAVTCLCLRTLNRQRASLLIQHYHRSGRVLSPSAISPKEHVWTPFQDCFQIEFGVPLHAILRNAGDLDWLRSALKYEDRTNDGEPKFVVRRCPNSNILQVVLHELAEGLDLLRAYMQASNMVRQRGELLAHQRTGEEFREFVAALRDKNWHVDSDIDFDDREWRCRWPDSK